MTSAKQMKQTNIKNLKKKIAVISMINLATLAFDIAMTYRVSRLQINNEHNINIYKSNSLQSIINAIQPTCYALAAIGDSFYLTKNDGFVDTISKYNDGRWSGDKVTDIDNDVSNSTDNWYWLLLHLTKSIVRAANYINIKGNPTPIDGIIENFKITKLTNPPNQPK